MPKRSAVSHQKKRKRRRSQDKTEQEEEEQPPPQPAQRQRRHDNPFLVARRASAKDNDTAATTTIVSWMLAFVDYNSSNAAASRANGTEEDDQDDKKRQEARFVQAVLGLVGVLAESERGEEAEQVDDDDGQEDDSSGQEQPSGGSDEKSSKYATEIARLLFPWALQQINKLVDSNNNAHDLLVPECYCWEAFRFALSHFLTIGETPPLTQSVLFKLVPRLVRCAVDHESDDATATTSSSKQSRQQAAKVFRVLIGHELFTPTLDVAVETVLLPLVDSLQLQDTYHTRRILPIVDKSGNARRRRKRAQIMLQTTLQWIHARLMSRQGHPRTNFGVLARPAVLLALARIHLTWQALPPGGRLLAEVEYRHDCAGCSRQVIDRIIYDGLVAPQHHMDGFKSLSVSKTFSCYQNDLLQTIEKALLQTEADVSGDVRDMAWFLPVLLRQFLQSSRVWYQGQSEKYKKRAPPLSALQFAVMERLAAPLLRALQRDGQEDASVATVGLRALREMLDLVDEFQAYVPAHDTQEQPQFRFLQTVATFLLEQPVSTAAFSGLEQYADTIMLVTRLLQLNHLLWRDQWPAVLGLMLQSGDARLRALLCTLWRVATETFTQLRQVDDWIQILATVSQSLENDEQTDVLADILTEASVERALALHTQSCPVKQIPSIFSSMQSSLNCPKTSILIGVVQPLVTTLLRSFKVDPSTADTVSASLQKFVTGTLENMVKSESVAVKKVSIEAFGWCIDLSLRCAFWLGPSAQLSVPFSVQSAMEETADADEVLLVIAHRLRQLSSLLHEARLSQVRQEASSNKEMEVLQNEGKQLATHLYIKANRMPTGRGWTLIAQFLHFWITFVGKDEIDGFLGWLVAVSSLESSMDEVPSPFRVPLGDIEQQKDVALSLLQDEAFYEVPAIAERFPAVAVRVTAQWITLAISGGHEGRGKTKDSFLSDAEEIMRLTESEFIAEWESVDLSAETLKADRDVAERRLCCATEALKVLNGVPGNGLSDHPQLFLSVLYLDRLVCDKFLNKFDARFYLTAVSLSCCLRKSLSIGLSLTNGSTTATILKFLRETLAQCSSPKRAQGPSEEDGLYVRVTAQAVEELLKNTPGEIFSNNFSVLRHWFDGLLTCIDEPTSDEENDSEEESSWESGSGSAFSWTDTILISHTLLSLNGREDVASETSAFADAVIKQYAHYIGETSDTAWQDLIVCEALAESLLCSKEGDENFELSSIRGKLVAVCLRSINNGVEPDEFLQVLLSLLALDVKLAPGLASRILQSVLLLEVGESSIPAIVSTCLRLVSAEYFGSFIESLVGEEKRGIRTRVLLARLLFVDSFFSENQTDWMQNNKTKLLDFALQTMLQADGENPDTAPRAAGVWIQAVQSGHSIKREKLVVLVGSIPQVLRRGAPSTQLYVACAKLMALLLQRYSKHCSACAPVVVVALQSFLRQLTDAKVDAADLSLKARHWTRLCEILVPQKEVYKKHLVHIVLESLRAADDGDLKRALMPGWMHLLDTFSPEYELKQLNALMEDTTTKLLFRPIYDQYKRHHAYHGH